MADDWQPGDLALCVKGRRRGSVFTVRWVSPPDDNTELGGVSIGLRFYDIPDKQWPNWLGYDARIFRKIRPHTPDAEDAETIRLLTGAPVREPVA